MAGPRKREIRDQDVQGLKCLRKIRPLLSRLRTVGTERDTAGNRRLFMDQYCALILMSLFSPAIESLRDLQRACALDKVRKRLGVNRASLGSLSESVAIFDPAPLKEIAIELGHTIRSRPDRRFDSVGQQITAVDGTVIATVKRVAELSWTPKAKGKHLSAYRLHTHFEVLSGKAERINATSASPKGDADERAVLQRRIDADRCYIVDLGWKARHRTRPDHPMRLICVAVKPHESSRGWKGPHCDGVLRLVTNRLDLPAELIAEIQAYCGTIVCMLILLYTGEKPNRAMYQMVWYELIGTRGSMLRR